MEDLDGSVVAFCGAGGASGAVVRALVSEDGWITGGVSTRVLGADSGTGGVLVAVAPADAGVERAVFVLVV